jgi:hypothetical protein
VTSPAPRASYLREMGDCHVIPPVAEAGTVARAMDMFAIFGTGVVVVACILAVVILYFIFRIEEADE